jgi:porin
MRQRLSPSKLAPAVLRTALGVIVFHAAAFPVAAEETGRSNPYSGEFPARSTLTGDWGGSRNDLAGKGITFDASLTQTGQKVVDGGKVNSWRNEGRGNLTVGMDTAKMGLWQGGFLTVELEGNWGQAVNLDTGALMTVNTNHAFPVVAATVFAVPAVSLRQWLSKDYSVAIGKLDTIATGDVNAFAHGKGDDQFMNLAFNINPVLIMTVPYSTLGAGVVYQPASDPGALVASLSLVSSVGEANTSGFSELSANALTLTGEVRWRTSFFGRTGHQLVGFTWSNKEFSSLDQRLGDYQATGQIAKKQGSWALIYNFDQYVYEAQYGPGTGVGIFGRLGISDGNPNPAKGFASLGLGGKGVPSRPRDEYGFAWYTLNVTSPKFTDVNPATPFLQDEQGVEAYYGFALTPWAVLTVDAQVVNPSQEATRAGQKVETATVFGARLRLAF